MQIPNYIRKGRKMNVDYAIVTKNLTKVYGNITAVNNLNLNIEFGEIFGLLGPNGAGKTTTLHILCTMIKQTSGTATVNGLEVLREPSKVRESIGIVFQDPSVDDRLTGRENLEFHGMLYDVPRDIRKKRTEELLSLVELSDRADDLVRTYSGGMRRRLELARGLIHHPKILFLDEPTIGLDPQTRAYIWEYIENIIKEENLTVLLTTHYMEEAERFCDRVAIMDYGDIKVLDTPIDLKDKLKGDLVVIETEDPNKLSTLLKDLGDVTIVDNTLKLRAPNGDQLIPKVVRDAASAGVSIKSISLQKPTLDDVFLYHTGRKIRAEKSDYRGTMFMIRRRRVR